MFTSIARIDKTLRPYQQKAKEDIFAAWDDCEHVLFQMPTGTGKTRLFTSIISDIKVWCTINEIDFKILIIAHRIELIEQISESLDKYKVPHGIIAGGKQRNLRPQIQVASIQTLSNHHNSEVAESMNAGIVIIDEAHHSSANSYKKLWQLYPEAKFLGVTATPWRMNHKGFNDIYERLIVSQSISDFIGQGWLSPYSYYSVKQDSAIRRDIEGIEEFDTEGDYKVSAMEQVMDNASIRANLLNSYLQLAKGKKGIIYSVSRKHSDHICEEYRSAGVNIVRIDSETPREERRLYVQRFKNGLIDIIVNVDIFSEGFDCPDIEFIQLARPTKSLVKYLQQVGRGLRPTLGKTKCVILDNVGAHLEFNLPDSDRDWETEFVGYNSSTKKRIQGNSTRDSQESSERSFDEGSDSMLLIEDVANTEEKNVANNWSPEDDLLLKTLYFDRKCPVSVIVSVFNREECEILERISYISNNS